MARVSSADCSPRAAMACARAAAASQPNASPLAVSSDRRLDMLAHLGEGGYGQKRQQDGQGARNGTVQ